jgi:hypothetical protein
MSLNISIYPNFFRYYYPGKAVNSSWKGEKGNCELEPGVNEIKKPIIESWEEDL